ncbi:MAG: transglycosylase SLT domain-containing protein [Cellvibrionaceae bacterium]
MKLIYLTLLLAFALPISASQTQVDEQLRTALSKAINNAESFDDRFDAEVWLMSMSDRLKPFVKKAEQRLQLLKAIHREAKRADLEPSLVLAVIQIESHFDRFAISRVGAQGMMQIMPFWKNEIGRPSDNLMDTDTNLRYGCTILKHYLKREKGNWRKALARYNGSVGKHKYPEKVLTVWTDRWR